MPIYQAATTDTFPQSHPLAKLTSHGAEARTEPSSWFAGPMAIIALLILAFPLFFWRLGSWPFFDPDETRYAEIPREMLARGDWVTPTLNHVVYFEKPPLLYWCHMVVFRVLGFSEWSGRLVPALAALIGVLLIYGLGRRMFGARAGWLGAVIGATSVFWAVEARDLLIDTVFAITFFAALVAWWLGQSESNSHRGRWYFIAGWLALALAVLAKGPVAVVLVGAILATYTLWCGQRRAWRHMPWLSGVALFLLVSAPWFVVVALRNPGFSHFFWYNQHVERFLGIGVQREHVQPVYYFLVLWPLVFFPWSVFVPGALVAHRRALWGSQARRTPRQQGAVFCAIAILVVTIFFSSSSGKLITYILPAFPPLAAVLGGYFDAKLTRNAWTRAMRVGLGLLVGVLLIIAAVVFAAGPRLAQRLDAEAADSLPWLGAIALVWVLALLVAATRPRVEALLATTALGFIVFFGGFVAVLPGLVSATGAKPLMAYIQPGIDAGGELVQFGGYIQGCNYYSGQRTRVIDKGRTEIDYGAGVLSTHERNYWFPSERGALSIIMAQARPVYCFLNRKAFTPAMTAGPDGVIEIISNHRFVVLGNRAAARITPARRSS